MTNEPATELDEFARNLAAALGLDDIDVVVADVLALASDAAHAYIRPAAPIATFLAGVAAGRTGATPDALADAVSQSRDFCARPPENLG
jgi:pyrrolidone-carboxylate peptidase